MKAAYKNTFVRISVLAMLLFFTVVFITMRLENNDLQARAAELQAEIDTVNETINQLRAEIARPFDDEYVAEVAHEQLGLCYPQEVIYISGDGN